MPLVSQSEIVDGDPEDPQRLVLHLQATAGGCQWMLDRWSELRSILEEGLDWQSADKLKAVRLLGRHPMEAVDDRNVLMIFVACQAIESRTSIPIPEIWNELREYERKPYAQRLIGRGIEKLRPTDAAAARQALYAIIDRATAQIAVKAERIASGRRSTTPWPPTDWRLTTARKESGCVASTWLAAGGWHARSTHCSSSAGPRNWLIVRRPICRSVVRCR